MMIVDSDSHTFEQTQRSLAINMPEATIPDLRGRLDVRPPSETQLSRAEVCRRLDSRVSVQALPGFTAARIYGIERIPTRHRQGQRRFGVDSHCNRASPRFARAERSDLLPSAVDKQPTLNLSESASSATQLNAMQHQLDIPIANEYLPDVQYRRIHRVDPKDVGLLKRCSYQPRAVAPNRFCTAMAAGRTRRCRMSLQNAFMRQLGARS